VIQAALLAALIMAVAAPHARAQTANSTAGDVGSAASRNGYPAAGGAIALPALPASGTATTAAGTTAATSGGTVSGSAGGTGGGVGGGGRTGTNSAGSAARSSGAGGGTHWVLCPPTGSSGLSPLFTGTDLSCTPD
jgi:hypothetical protein